MKNDRPPVDAKIQRVLDEAKQKYIDGEKKHGVLDVETDPRDFLLEAKMELLDTIVYFAAEIMKIDRRIELRDRAEQKPRYHQSQSVHLALTLRDEDLRFLTHNDGSPMGPIEARKELKALRDRGFDLMPVGECDNFDPKKGCMGHKAAVK